MFSVSESDQLNFLKVIAGRLKVGLFSSKLSPEICESVCEPKRALMKSKKQNERMCYGRFIVSVTCL